MPADPRLDVERFEDAQLLVFERGESILDRRGADPVPVHLGRLVLDEPPGARQPFARDLMLGDVHASQRLHEFGLDGAQARADGGEPRGVHADDVGRQDARSAVGAEADDGVAGVDAPQSAVAAEMQRLAVVTAVADVFVAGEPAAVGWGRIASDGAAGQGATAALAAGEGAGHRLHVEDVLGGLCLLGHRHPAAEADQRHHAAERRGDLHRVFHGRQGRHRDLVLGQGEGEGLLGVFEVDGVGHQPAAIQGVLDVGVAEGDADREAAGIDGGGPVDVADELDDRVKFDAGAVRDLGHPQAIRAADAHAHDGRVGRGDGLRGRAEDLDADPLGARRLTTWTSAGQIVRDGLRGLGEGRGSRGQQQGDGPSACSSKVHRDDPPPMAGAVGRLGHGSFRGQGPIAARRCPALPA